MKNSRMPWNTLAILSETPSVDLSRLAAEIAERQENAGEQDADGIEPAEKGDDDRGEAIAGRDRRL